MKLHNKSKMVNRSKNWLLFPYLGNFLTIFFNDVYFHEIFLHLFIYLWKRAWHCWLPRSTECQLPKWPASSAKNRKKKKIRKWRCFFRFSYILLHGYIFLLLFGKKVPNFNQAEKMPLYTPRIIKIMIYVFFFFRICNSVIYVHTIIFWRIFCLFHFLLRKFNEKSWFA